MMNRPSDGFMIHWTRINHKTHRHQQYTSSRASSPLSSVRKAHEALTEILQPPIPMSISMAIDDVAAGAAEVAEGELIELIELIDISMFVYKRGLLNLVLSSGCILSGCKGDSRMRRYLLLTTLPDVLFFCSERMRCFEQVSDEQVLAEVKA